MSERDVALIDELRTAENALVEFKHNNCDAKLIAKLCSALSNAARIDNKDFAYVLWGIDDASHNVIGTSFNPESVKPDSNTVLQLWLAQRLKPSVAFSFRRIAHPQGSVVMLEIPAATSAPVAFDDIA
jgi:ATP-dependent DNA helicase RecG